MDFKNDWLAACFAADGPRQTILVKFDGREDRVEYSAYMLDMIASEKTVEYITDSETGEILYWR